LKEAVEAKDRYPDAVVVSGGTDFVLEVNKHGARPSCVIGLEGIEELQHVEPSERGWRVGAAVPLSDLEGFAAQRIPPLAKMLRYFGSRQIKHRATVGGSLCNASPIGDIAPVLLGLGAEVVVASGRGERRIPIDDFFTGYRQTQMRPGELLVAVDIDRIAPRARAGAYKVSKRRELDISVVSGCFCVEVDDLGYVAEARLAYGGMAATPARASTAEAAMRGKRWNEQTVEAACGALASDFTPMSDHRGSAWYRSTVAANLIRGFFRETQGDPPERVGRPSGTVLGGGDL